MLNREECDNALTRLLRPYFAKVDVQNVYHDINRVHSIDEDSNLLTLLIMEHFSNPPLTWEELKECNVVYDKKLKKYRLINELLEDGFIYFTYTTDTRIGEYYEPNRFYRKEVQEWSQKKFLKN